MSEKICYACDFNNDEATFCEQCGAPLDLSEYIQSKKLDKNIPEKIKSLFGRREIDRINDEIEEFINYFLGLKSVMDDFGLLIAGKFNQDNFKSKYKKLDNLNDFKYLDIIKKDDDLKSKHDFLTKAKSFIDRFDFDMLDKVDDYYSDLEKLRGSNFYVTYLEKDNLKDRYKSTFDFVDELASEIDLAGKFAEFYEDYNSLDVIVTYRNRKYVEAELDKHKAFFDDVDGKSLDKNQRLAVVKNEQNSQIIAGAGCGKTLTVNAKVRYLIEKKGINPNEILCLSFSNASIRDLKEKLPEDVEISTFHSLGSSILKANNQPSSVDEYAMNNFVKDYFKNNVINNESLCRDIVDYYSYYFYSPVGEAEASTLGEVYDLEASRDYRNLKTLYGGDNDKVTYANEYVRSYDELIISNYLYAHQIDYQYERVFEFDNRYFQTQKEFIFKLIFNEVSNYPEVLEEISEDLLDLLEIKEHVKLYGYTPDFYIKENDLYYEHFGVDRNCKAQWRDEKGQKDYLDGIYWKRALHKGYGSNLLETYSYYQSEGRLLERLEEKLKAAGVEVGEVDYEWLFSKIIEKEKVNKFENFISLITEFIALFKGNDYNDGKFAEFKKQNEATEDEFDKKRTELFLNIVEVIYLEYENYLKEISKIDFNDMINNATREVEKGNLPQNYRYILVDEYQDTSYTRYNLVKAIQDKTNAKVCVVGDDWQSIYRFAGCDVSLFSNFENYFKNPDKLKIQTTYRNSQELIDISGRFIKKNPNQINKSLQSKKDSANKPVKLVYYNQTNSESKIKAMESVITKISKESNDIMILGRNNFDINDYIDAGLFKRKTRDDSSLIYTKNNNLNVEFISVHKSKGLESDNVILINLENSIVGFPNQMVDDKLLNFVINDSDQYPNGEERRLFYVALTRTKNNVYLLVPDTNKSEFVVELEENRDELEIITNEYDSEEVIDDLDDFMKDKKAYSIKTHLKCPTCKTGDVILKVLKSKDGEELFKFFECSHGRCEWRGGSYYSSLELLDEIEICPKCGKVKYIVNGMYGPYLRCSKKCKNIKLTGKKLKRANEVFNNDIKIEIEDYDEINTNLKCPECGEADIIIQKNKKTGHAKVVCSQCEWDGGIFDKTGKVDTIEYCKVPECSGITYIRKGPYGEFRTCSNYFKTKCNGKIKTQKTKSKWKTINIDLTCPSCNNGDVILMKNQETGRGFFKCSSNDCDWNGGSFNKSQDLIHTLRPCPENGCDGLTYEITKNNRSFRVCTNYPKTKCQAGRKKYNKR